MITKTGQAILSTETKLPPGGSLTKKIIDSATKKKQGIGGIDPI